MRFLAALNGRYTLRQSALILLPTIAVLLVAQPVATAAGAGHSLAEVITLVATFGTFFAMTTVINRRTRP
jgi:uncharacterized membrane protein